MLKREITYTDFNDEEQTEVCHFNLTRVEVTRLEAQFQGNLAETIERFVIDKDYHSVVMFFEQLVVTSYGVKSVDGRIHDKNPLFVHEFKMSAAYDALFAELLSDTDQAIAFFKAVMPKPKVESTVKKDVRRS